MKKRKWFIQDNMFIQETYCKNPSLAIPIHEHKAGNSHETRVITGSIRIFNESGWEVVLGAGQTIDLSDNLRHGIETISEESLFHNISSIENFSKCDIDELINAGTLIYEDKNKDTVKT